MKVKNSGLSRRIFAKILDLQIIVLLLILPLTILKFSPEDMDLLITAGTYALAAILLYPAISIFYQTLFIKRFGGTLGKLLFGLKVKNYDTGENISYKIAFLRSTVGYIFSFKFLGLGFLRITKNSENLGWHDELFNTKVTVEKKPMLGILALLISIIGVVLAGIYTGSSIAEIFPIELLQEL